MPVKPVFSRKNIKNCKTPEIKGLPANKDGKKTKKDL